MKGFHDTFRKRRNSIRERFALRRRRSSSRSLNTESSWKETGGPKVLLTSDALFFDPITFRRFREEGYDVAYLPHAAPPKQYQEQVQKFADLLEEKDRYAIVAYGPAAGVVLDACKDSMPRLCAVVAYYPTHIPVETACFPSSLNYQIHLAETQRLPARLKNCYVYHRSDIGFAEHDSPSYHCVNAQLAWSRTITCLRKGFDIRMDLAPILENHIKAKHDEKDIDKTLSTVAEDICVSYVPAMTGGVGKDELRKFYSEYLIPGNPPSLDIRLISRTVGVDHIVDELYLSFHHTQEIPWMLPGVPPTNKYVEVAMVSVVGIRAGKLCQENVYWDQASVLVQIGLLDPKYIPASFHPIKTAEGAHKAERLPVFGGESAKKVLEPELWESNSLILGSDSS